MKLEIPESSRPRCYFARFTRVALIAALIGLSACRIGKEDDQTDDLLVAFLSPGSNLACILSPCKYIFLSEATYTGALSGTGGADVKCQNDKNKPAGGTYLALIADGDARKPDYFARKAWVLGDGIALLAPTVNTLTGEVLGTRHVGYAYNGVLTFPLQNTVSDGALPLWTGIKNDSSWLSDDFNDCNNWTSALNTYNGQSGTANAADYALISASPLGCDAKKHLLCVEQ